MEQEHPLVFGDGAAPVVQVGSQTTPPVYEATERQPLGPPLHDSHAAMERQTAAVQKILKALAPLPPEGRMRVIRAAAALFGVALP